MEIKVVMMLNCYSLTVVHMIEANIAIIGNSHSFICTKL